MYRILFSFATGPETLLIVAREFRAAVRMARAAGLRDAGAVLAADRLTSELTGFSPVALLDEDVAGLPDFMAAGFIAVRGNSPGTFV